MIPELADMSPRAERPTANTTSPTCAGLVADGLHWLARAGVGAKHSQIGSRVRPGNRDGNWFPVVSDAECVGAAESVTHRHDHTGPPNHPA